MTAPERRAAILEAAVRIFAEHGFRGATTREIAAAVGVTEPVLYEHFRTKRDLYTAIIDAKSLAGFDLFQQMLAPFAEADDDRGFFTSLAEHILDFYERERDYIRLLLFSGLEGHQLAERFYERHSHAYLRLVDDYLERRMASGALRRVDTKLVAQAFAGSVAHYAQARVVHKCEALGTDRRTLVEGVVDVFLNGLTRVESGKGDQ